MFLQEFGQGDEVGFADVTLEGQAPAGQQVVDQLQRHACPGSETHSGIPVGAAAGLGQHANNVRLVGRCLAVAMQQLGVPVPPTKAQRHIRDSVEAFTTLVEVLGCLVEQRSVVI